ncbi:GntR family transcriptional regulator [Sulfitobacter porphyrae]|uniref:GntR family transcriptional regulator n=1 Tax=Sulfitobacter porphyrae TaxID=1246864 RepID=A0ABW2B6Y9_9RHOB
MPDIGINKSGTATHQPRNGQSTSSNIVRDVVKGLYEGRYVPGQRMAEPDLMALYGVSRSTVREALKQLNADGIVVLAAFRGAQIRKLSRAEARNLFSLTEVILGLAARQAAERIDTPGARERLEELLAEISSYRDESGRFEFLRRRNRYFRELVQISGNDELQTILPRLQVHLIRNKLSVPPPNGSKGIARSPRPSLRRWQRSRAAARAYVVKTAAYVLPHFPD